MQMCVPVRTPRWVSPRRVLEEKLSELQKWPNLNHAKQIHAQILRSNLHHDPFVVPKLVAALSLCRQISLAAKVFDQIPQPNSHLYNTMIRAHILNAQTSQAFELFFAMQTNGVSPDNFTYSFLLKACNGKSLLPLIRMIHCHIVKCGFCADIFVPNSLIDSYCKSGPMGVSAAKKVFTAMEERDVVTWNTMIGGLVKFGEVLKAREMFDEMSERDLCTWNIMLDGYVKAGRVNEAFEFFQQMPERNVVSWSTIVSGYSRAGDIEMARMIFDKMPAKNLITWTIIVSGYAKKGLASEATELYDRMEKAGFRPDDATVNSVLAACAESGLLGLGEKVHESLIGQNGAELSTQMCNALVDMYAKCGSLDKAYQVFEDTRDKDLVTWNAMLHGLATHGRAEEALQFFDRMRKAGFKPDSVTFIGVLCACTHAGFVKEGLFYFDAMERDYGIVPRIEHYGCVIDLLGRGGRLDEALGLVKTMPMEPNAVIWGTLLSACGVHKCTELAREVLNRLAKLEPSEPGNFLALSNIYAANRDWHKVANSRVEMRNSGGRKPSGTSFIEVENEVHEFTAFDESHPQSDKIYQMIGKLSHDLKRIGYVTIGR